MLLCSYENIDDPFINFVACSDTKLIRLHWTQRLLACISITGINSYKLREKKNGATTSRRNEAGVASECDTQASR